MSIISSVTSQASLLLQQVRQAQQQPASAAGPDSDGDSASTPDAATASTSSQTLNIVV